MKNDDPIDRIADLGDSIADPILAEHGEDCPLHEAASGLKQAAQGLRIQNARAKASGPAMVASRAYRSGWETLFGSKTTAGEA